jgi:DNA-binding transcriptional ArsR family regulator
MANEAADPSNGAAEGSDEHLVNVFRALGDPTRLQMMRMISRDGEVACTTFLDRFAVTKSTISYHVRILRSAHLVAIRKEGTFYFYRLAPDVASRLPALTTVLSESSRQRPAGVS